MIRRPPRPPQAVVFDNDGVLLDTESAWTRAERTLFERHGAAFTADHKRALIGSSRTAAAAMIEEMLGLPGRGLALMDDLHALVMEELLAGVEPMPGALAALDAVRAAGLPVAVATNSPPDFARRALGAVGVLERLDAVVCASDVARGKPAPDVYLEACARLRAVPGRCVGLEDSPSGVAALRAAGLFAIGVPSFPGVTLDGADLLASSLEDPAVHEALGISI